MVDPQNDEMVDPHNDEMVDPHNDEMVDPHNDEMVDPQNDEMVDPQNDEMVDPQNDEMVDPHDEMNSVEVKHKGFWPKKGDIRKTFERMSGSGIIQRKDLYLIWEQKHFNKILPYKEFIFDMLIHLDILSEQRRYDTKTGNRLPVENFFVPCMLTQRNDTSFMANECTPEKAISLAFVFKGTIIPPALANRLISACLSMWTVKAYEGRKLLFSGFIGLSFDKVHDIVVCVEANKILLYIVHRTSNGLIVPDIATGIKESMFTTLERISEFYQSTVHAISSSQKLPFHIEYACSRLECHIPEEAAFTTDEWICHKHKIVHTKDKWNIWNQDQVN
ncbi:unnamed protein product [Mytilus edulis]|uniref:Uncharacterized protein n=1 Tax=Mytilus edulis TaxID=6550 RepID=A0A8S3TA07_MYTED|nr:unnamed protein product [Mytilus edulis]